MRLEDLERYDYALPPELIRKNGVEPRDSARLFVYDTKTDEIHHDVFSNLAKYLPERSLMVLNETRVVPARLWLRKETGGKIEVFVLVNEWDGGEEIPVLVDRKVVVGQKLLFPDGSFFEIVRQAGDRFYVTLIFSGLTAEKRLVHADIQRLNRCNEMSRLLDVFGETPVPHYLEEEVSKGEVQRGDKEHELRRRYQTIFAKTGASVAAPTASLHFTEQVFDALDEKGVELARVTLDVGQGTFAPLRGEHFETRKLHRERIEISESTAEKLNHAKSSEQSIVAVGTTALRTLESVTGPAGFQPYAGSTDIFIFPPHEFRSADILMTNFHLPKTSLMLLVDAFLDHKKAKRHIISLYEEAIRERYAFYSFGDSMLIL